MPLVHRRSVPLLPPPDVDALPKDTEVFYLKATNEIFLDYEAYTARLTYLQSNIFQCEYSGKSNLTYFQAVESEKAESRIVRERFPDELKGRVLFNVQFQVMGRLDSLVDLIYDRYKDRYFAGEKVFVDLSGDKYFARIAKAFPPASIRALAPDDDKPSSSVPPSSPAPTVVDDYSKVCHKIGTDMNVDAEMAKKDDDPDEYLYTVQLMDEEHKFEGSFMEVKAKALSRDRLAFSKSILKRYIRECVHRDAAIGSPWIVKQAIAVAFGIPTSQTDDIVEKNKQAKEAKLAKRRKTKDDPDPTPVVSKKKKLDGETGSSAGGAKKAAPAPKAIKYPIEDLDLDPMSIHDGRILRRVNAEPPSLPPKPIANKDILVPVELFDSFISTWNLINIFSKPLNISTFTLDEFSSALRHPFLDPKCVLLAELHSSLTNIIATDTSRVFGSTGAAPLPAVKGETASVVGAEDEEKDEIVEDGEGEEKEKGADEMEEEFDEELDALVRRGIAYSKRWDRMAKLKSADGRAGWERHVIGALCQRGGPLVMPNLTRILGHLFEGADQPAPTSIDPAAPLPATTDPLSAAALPPLPNLPPGFIPEGDAALGAANPEAAYLSLDIEDKVDILGYLCALAMGSKAVRGFIDESETQLTEFRKQRADVNKERKALLEQRALLEVQVDAPILNGTVVTESQGLPSPKPPPAASFAASPSLNGGSTPAPTNGNGNGHDHSTRAPDSDMLVNEDDEEDQLADDDDLATSSVGLVTPALGGRSSRASSVTSFSGKAMGAKSARQLAADEKKLADQAKAVEAAKAREVAKAKNAGRREADKQRLELDEQIKANGKKDDWVEREFRRWQGVSRCRPLGKDRFFCRYWWFDGVGGMELVGQGAGVLYGTGRLFVQGPSQEDWDAVCGREKEGEEDAIKRRVREEGGDEEKLLGVDEWGFYEQEEELDNLQNWLNAKGTRELSLKNALAKWRGYILAGSRKRLAESSGLIQRAPDARRSTRAKAEPELYRDQYLNWTNALAKY
ncbi:hypothetical protein BCR35DRAFT_353018 [Leucosporidium creatinivorum]|uniref:ATP-utilizing chromatin assembly and remodelling N-terminal-domain-containing protein n=1 Tax=Leucosporidium creatinivorum TaxID=106004 RepID=A0A1Y2F2D2_9BASI|nr:hypothetical protein BCR35DRAFT_353018 [Leucosporidium creatinivorum]